MVPSHPQPRHQLQHAPHMQILHSQPPYIPDIVILCKPDDLAITLERKEACEREGER
jgi:hypothetical protein